MFEEKMGKLRGEMQVEKRGREMIESNTIAALTDQISTLQGELFGERKNREETYDLIIKKLGNDVLRVNDIINGEKKVIFCRLRIFDGWKIDQRGSALRTVEAVGRNARQLAP